MYMPVFRFAAGQAPGGRVAQQTVVWQAKRGRNGRPGIGERRRLSTHGVSRGSDLRPGI